MNIENVKIGEVFKNYKALCEALEIKPTGGDSKKAQLKEVERYLEYTKNGHSFVINKIHVEPIRDSIKVGGSRDHLPFSEDLELLLVNLLLENGNKLIKSNSSFLRDLCMINSNYYEYFSNKETLSNLLEMDINHIADWYDATNASFKGYLETLIRKLENKKMIAHEKVIMVVFVDTNIHITSTGHTKASDFMEYDAERDVFINRVIRPETKVREATESEIKRILEIEGNILDEYECVSVQEVYLKGKIKDYYKELTKRLFNELNIKRSYKAHKIHINQNRLQKEQLEIMNEYELGLTKRNINEGIKERVYNNANKRREKSLDLHSFARNGKQTMRSSENYMDSIVKLNDNLIDISNIENLKILKEETKSKNKQVKITPEQEEFDSYVLDQLPFTELN